MPASQPYHQRSHEQQGDAPAHRDAVLYLQPTGHHDQYALTEDAAHTVEGAADAHIQGLILLRERYDVESVGSDVVRCRTEGHQPEKGQRCL